MASRYARGWTWTVEATKEREFWRLKRLSRCAFTRFKWEPVGDSPSVPYAAYRLFMLVYWSFWVIMSGIASLRQVDIPYPLVSDNNKGWYWFIYATNWTATLIGVYLLFACLCLSPRFSSRLWWPTWAVRTMVGTASLLVMSLYWSTIFPLFLYTDATDVNLHFINAVIMVMDVCASRIPVLLSHIYLPFAYATTYVLFSLIYYLCGGLTHLGTRFIYPLLDWGKPLLTTGVVVGVLFIGVPAAHGFLSFLDKSTWRAFGRDRECVYEEDERYGVRDTALNEGVAASEEEEGYVPPPCLVVEMKE